MCNNNNNSNSSCIAEILNVILVLQQNACCESGLDSCDRPTLGGGPNCLVCNTRPIMIFTCCSNGTPLAMPATKDLSATPTDIVESSRVFRVEKLDGNCCTCRVLIDNQDLNCSNPYIATNSFFTIDLNCVCAIKCLTDTYVDCVC
ncbi:MAG: hypothetical protein E7158_03305 [Firmicutes bacterium]|nr:hypothetical protein [Bacillota bacterium]